MSEILGIGRFKLYEGKLEEFKRLSAQAMEVVRAMDTGTLQFAIYFNDDRSECIIVERYKDSAAVMEHGAHVGDLMGSLQRDRPPATCSVSRAQSSERRWRAARPASSRPS